MNNGISKAEKQAKENLKRLIQRVKSDHSFGRIKTIRDYMDSIGADKKNWFPHELDKTLTFPELKEKLDDLRISVETEWWLRNNPPVITYTDEEQKLLNDGSKLELVLPQPVKMDDTGDEKDKDYGLRPSKREKATLFWFQKKFCKILLDNVEVRKYYGSMLIANAGYGKTFIFGAMVIRLIEAGFHIGKTKSPFPYTVITKASVVEQTQRVLDKWFGIDLYTEVMVTNYDQLRATFGEIFLQQKMVVESGYEHWMFQWNKFIHPCVFVIDESQACKNEDSQQSKIICAISRIEEPVYCIFSSATPFERVSGAKYWVVNCRVDDRELSQRVL